jgi:hypothetical protein
MGNLNSAIANLKAFILNQDAYYQSILTSISWSGRLACGPRHLIPVLPFIIIMHRSISPRLNRLFFPKNLW